MALPPIAGGYVNYDVSYQRDSSSAPGAQRLCRRFRLTRCRRLERVRGRADVGARTQRRVAAVADSSRHDLEHRPPGRPDQHPARRHDRRDGAVGPVGPLRRRSLEHRLLGPPRLRQLSAAGGARRSDGAVGRRSVRQQPAPAARQRTARRLRSARRAGGDRAGPDPHGRARSARARADHHPSRTTSRRALLRDGLHDFSLEGGAIREDYGLSSFRYGRAQLTGNRSGRRQRHPDARIPRSSCCARSRPSAPALSCSSTRRCC